MSLDKKWAINIFSPLVCILLLIPSISIGANLTPSKEIPEAHNNWAPHTWWFYDFSSGNPRIVDSPDGTNPNDGVSRWWAESYPEYVNTNVNTNIGSPYPAMSDWIGQNGKTGTQYYSSVEACTGWPPAPEGASSIFVMEIDKYRTTPPRVYISNNVQIGTIPNGYIWAGRDYVHWGQGDQEVMPSGTPPTTFYRPYGLAPPVLTPGSPGTFFWAGLNATPSSDTAGNPENWIDNADLMKASSSSGPWTRVAIVAFDYYGNGSAYSNNITINNGSYYCVRPVWRGGVRSLVYSLPTYVGETFRIPVFQGWNLISLPLQTIIGTLPSALRDYNGDTQWDRVLWYNSTNVNDRWKQYNTKWASKLNDLLKADSKMGVWINITSVGDGFLNVTGLISGSTQIPLKAGWNLVGYPTLCGNQTVANAFWGTSADIVEAFDPSTTYHTKVVGPSYIMKPGEAYWVHVAADSVWTVDW